VEAHGKKYSKAFNSGPWKTEFDAMALKTCIRKLCKLLPKSIEKLQVAVSLDERHEAGIAQHFSAEVPLELQAASEEPGEAPPAVAMPQRLSGTGQESAA
jgi:recombinational DNA repair protein RecT